MTRIVDLSCDLSGRYASRLLADHGYEVIGVELPEDSGAMSAIAEAGVVSVDLNEIRSHLDRNKTIVTIDYNMESGREELGALLATADVVIHTFTPDVARRFSLDREGLKAAAPDAVAISITAYGAEGVEQGRQATEKTLYAEGGGLLISGMAETRYPLCPNLPIASTIGGIYAAMSALVNLYERRRTKDRSFAFVDIALRDLLPISLERVLAFFTYMKVIPYRGARRERIAQAAGFGEFAAKDGDFHVFAIHDPYTKIAELIDRPDLAQDEEWLNPHLRKIGPEAVAKIVADGIAEKTLAELEARARKLRIPAGPVIEVDKLEGLPQLQHRKALTRIGDGLDIEEPYRFARYQRDRRPGRYVRGVGELPKPAEGGEERVHQGHGRGTDGPLAGLRVLDLTHAYAGPSSTRILSDLGAEVIKVESVTRIDGYPRGILPFDNNPTDVWWERSGYFAERNLGKKNITLDMSTTKGREIFVSLLDHVDMVATNFTPRVMAGWGLGPERLMEMKPELVVLSMSGFGGTGPDSEKPALAGLIEASSGFTAMIRYADNELPTDVGFSFGDMISGLFAALSTMMTLDRRDRTGLGDVIDLSCCESPLPLLVVQLQRWARTGKHPSVADEIVSGGRHVLIRTAADDTPERWVLAFVRDGQEEAFAAIVQHSARDAVLSVDRRQAELVEDLRGQGFIAAPLANAEELLFSPELRARKVFEVVDRPTVGPLPHSRAFPILRNGEPMGRGSLNPPPKLGEHSAQVLEALAGIEPAAYAALVEEKITGEKPAGNLPSALRRPIPLDELERRGRVRAVPGAAEKMANYFGYRLRPAETSEIQKKQEHAQ